MIFKRPSRPAAAAIAAALLLSSCGKQEAVGDVPSGEELAKQADAASQAIRDEAAANAETGQEDEAAPIDSAAMISYANALRGFSIMVPKDWAIDEAASDDNGRTYNSEKLSANLAVSWIENREDADMKAAVDALEKAGENMSGEYVNENEYRASGSASEGQMSEHRLLRKADGTMISAVATYPAEAAKNLSPLAKQIIDSLALQ